MRLVGFGNNRHVTRELGPGFIFHKHLLAYPVFQGMESDYGYPPLPVQQIDRLLERPLEYSQLIVHCNPPVLLNLCGICFFENFSSPYLKKMPTSCSADLIDFQMPSGRILRPSTVSSNRTVSCLNISSHPISQSQLPYSILWETPMTVHSLVNDELAIQVIPELARDDQAPLCIKLMLEFSHEHQITFAYTNNLPHLPTLLPTNYMLSSEFNYQKQKKTGLLFDPACLHG